MRHIATSRLMFTFLFVFLELYSHKLHTDTVKSGDPQRGSIYVLATTVDHVPSSERYMSTKYSPISVNHIVLIKI